MKKIFQRFPHFDCKFIVDSIHICDSTHIRYSMEENRQGLSDIVVETRRDGTSVGKIDLLHYSLYMYLFYMIILT